MWLLTKILKSKIEKIKKNLRKNSKISTKTFGLETHKIQFKSGPLELFKKMGEGVEKTPPPPFIASVFKNSPGDYI